MSAAAVLPEVHQHTVITPRVGHSRLDDVIVYGTASLLLLAPLAFGAVEPWAILILEGSSATLFAAWFVKELKQNRIRVNGGPLFSPMLAFASILFLQVAFGRSAYDHATVSSILLYTAYGLICFLIFQTLTRTRQLRRISTAIVIYGTAVAMLAVLQSVSSTTKIYWIRTAVQGAWIYGPYVNHNHYAGLMELLTPAPLVFAFSRFARGRERWAAAAAATLMGATIFLSGSRGGMLSFVAQIGMLIYFLFREKSDRGKGLMLGGVLLTLLLFVVWVGDSSTSARITSFDVNHRGELTQDTRVRIDRDALRMVARRPLLGWGAGTFESVFPGFQSFAADLAIDKAHNDYLQTAVETGLFGCAVVIWFLVVTFKTAWKKTKKWDSEINGAVSLAAMIAIAGILVHSLVDFNLQIPANAALFYSLCTIAAMDARFTSHRRHHHRKTDSEIVATEL